MEDAKKDNSDLVTKLNVFQIELKKILSYISYVEEKIDKNTVPLKFENWKEIREATSTINKMLSKNQ